MKETMQDFLKKRLSKEMDATTAGIFNFISIMFFFCIGWNILFIKQHLIWSMFENYWIFLQFLWSFCFQISEFAFHSQIIVVDYSLIT